MFRLAPIAGLAVAAFQPVSGHAEGRAYGGMHLRVVQFFAVVLTALALVPGGAHLFKLPNKIDLPREGYVTVQGIYRGWALFGFVLIGAVAANLALAVRVRRRRRPFWLALAVLPGRGAGRAPAAPDAAAGGG